MSTKKGREGFKLARWLSRWWFERFFDFTLILVEMIQFHEHIFQMGWFNHHSQELATRKISWDPKGSRIVSQPSIFSEVVFVSFKEGILSALPETNIFAPENGWLEYSFPFGFQPIFSRELAVSFRECSSILLSKLMAVNVEC